MTLPSDCTQDLDALLAMLPLEEHDSALATLRAVRYPVTRLLGACARGELDVWQLRQAIRFMKEDCPR
ncbi:MAG: hypothetical protein HY914_10140 [Desulfomonile tiedjei]|nr:hypothetical protein [Desulfomonile tiedjei]